MSKWKSRKWFAFLFGGGGATVLTLLGQPAAAAALVKVTMAYQAAQGIADAAKAFKDPSGGSQGDPAKVAK
jgi:hypothetical protein